MKEEELAYRTPDKNPEDTNKKIWLLVALVVIVVIVLLFFFLRPKNIVKTDELTAEEREILIDAGTAEDSSLLTDEEENILSDTGTASEGSLLTDEELKILGESGSVR